MLTWSMMPIRQRDPDPSSPEPDSGSMAAGDPAPGTPASPGSDPALSSATRRDRALAAMRRRLAGTWLEDLGARLKALDVVNAITLFGAALLLSALPFLILLSALASERIDDDVSNHIGLNRQGAHIIHGLFRKHPAQVTVPIVVGLLIAFAGTMAVVSSLQVIYERVFNLERRGWRDFPRYLVWVVVLVGLLYAVGALSGGLHSSVGAVGQLLASFVALSIFFAWSIHFLLAGRVPWGHAVRPALLTALLWVGLAVFSENYFSSALVSDSQTYGTIGAVFTLLSWFIAIGGVIVLGAAGGAVWQERANHRKGDPRSSSDRGMADGESRGAGESQAR